MYMFFPRIGFALIRFSHYFNVNFNIAWFYFHEHKRTSLHFNLKMNVSNISDILFNQHFGNSWYNKTQFFFFTFCIFIACIVLKLSTEYHTKIQLSSLLYWIILSELFQIKLYKINAFGYVLVSISFSHAISNIIITTKLKNPQKHLYYLTLWSMEHKKSKPFL